MKIRLENLKKIFCEISRYTLLYYLVGALVLMTCVDGRRAYLRRLHKVTYWSDYLIQDTDNTGAIDEKNLRRSIIYYKLLLKVYPDLSRAYGMMGYCYYRIGEYQRSLRAYQEAIKKHPSFFWFHYNLGLVYFQSGDYETASGHLEKVASQDLDQMSRIAVLDTLNGLEKKNRADLYKIAGLFAAQTQLKSQQLLALSQAKTPSPVPLRPVFHPWARFIHVGKEKFYSRIPAAKK